MNWECSKALTGAGLQPDPPLLKQRKLSSLPTRFVTHDYQIEMRMTASELSKATIDFNATLLEAALMLTPRMGPPDVTCIIMYICLVKDSLNECIVFCWMQTSIVLWDWANNEGEAKGAGSSLRDMCQDTLHWQH